MSLGIETKPNSVTRRYEHAEKALEQNIPESKTNMIEDETLCVFNVYLYCLPIVNVSFGSRKTKAKTPGKATTNTNMSSTT